MSASELLRARLDDFEMRYTGNASGLDENIVLLAEAAVDAAVLAQSVMLMDALDRYEAVLAMSGVVAP